MPITSPTKDWFAVNISLPSASAEDLQANDITADNTTLKDRDYYKESSEVQKMFTDPNNDTFNEDSYNQYYDVLVNSYNDLSSKSYMERAMDAFEYLPIGDAPKRGKAVTDLYSSKRITNPYGSKKGASGINQESAPDLSYKEIAQNNYVYDGETGKSLGWKPNDDDARGILDFWYKPPVAIATYEKDETIYDPQSGRQIQHKRGDRKLDKNGKLYYETIGMKEPYGRDVLNWTDTLTVDDTWQDKYNFMSSDGLDKSITGAIMKNVITYAPMFISGPAEAIYASAGAIYALGTLGAELLNVMPMLTKSGIALFAGDSQVDKDYWKTLNRLQQTGASMSLGGASEFGKEHFFSTENIINTIGSTFGFLKSQAAIAQIPYFIGMTAKSSKGVLAVSEAMGETMANKVATGSLTTFEKNAVLEKVPEAADYINRTIKSQKLASSLATTYMATTMAASITEQSKELGLDERDAAALYLGASLALFGQMKLMPIGHWVLKGIGIDEMGAGFKASLKEKEDILIKGAAKLNGVEKGTTARYKGFFKLGDGLGQHIYESMSNPTTYLAAAGAQGVEMMAIDAIKDGVLNVYNGMVGLNMVSSDDQKTFTFGTAQDIMGRYGSSFFGGALGGALFKLNDNLLAIGRPKGKKELTDLAWFIRNGYSQKIYDSIDKGEQQGIYGSKSLTFTTSDAKLPGLENKTNYTPAASYADSQNAMLAEVLRKYVKNTENAIFQFGAISDIALSKSLDEATGIIVDLKLTSPLFTDYNNIVTEIVRINGEIDKTTAAVTEETVPPSAIDAAGTAVQKLKVELAQEELKLKEITDGTKFREYQRIALFGLNAGKNEYGHSLSINEPFVNLSPQAFCKEVLGKNYADLTPEEKLDFEQKYKTFRDTKGIDRIRKGFEYFTSLMEKMSPHIFNLNQYIEDTKVQQQYAKQQFNILTTSAAIKKFQDDILTAQKLGIAPTMDDSFTILNKNTIKELESSKDSLDKPSFSNSGIRNVLYEKYKAHKDKTAAEVVDKLRALEGIREITTSKAIDASIVDATTPILKEMRVLEMSANEWGPDILMKYEEKGVELEEGIENQFKTLTASFRQQGLDDPIVQLKLDVLASTVLDLPKLLQKYRDLIATSLAEPVEKGTLSDVEFDALKTQKEQEHELVKVEDLKTLDEVEKMIYDTPILDRHKENLEESIQNLHLSSAELQKQLAEAEKIEDINQRNSIIAELQEKFQKSEMQMVSHGSRIDDIDMFKAGGIDTLGKLLDHGSKLLETLYAKRTNALNELLKKFELVQHGKNTDIIEMLMTEFDNLSKQASILDYQINDPQILHNLEYASNLIAQLKSTITAATNYEGPLGKIYGYNNTINNTFPELKLETIKQENSIELIDQLAVISRKIDFLKELSTLNAADKLKNNKESGVNIEALQFANLSQGSPLRSYLNDLKMGDEGESFMNSTITGALNDATLFQSYLDNKLDKNSPFNMPETQDELVELDRQMIEVHKAIYDRLQYFIKKEPTGKDEAERQSVVQKQLFGLDTYNNMSEEAKRVFPALDLSYPIATEFTSTETVIRPLDSFVWFNVTMMTNPIEFLDKVRGKALTDGTHSGVESSKYVPFYSQEYAVKVIYSALTNPQWFNTMAAMISGKDSYLPEIIKPLYNTVFMDGGTGVGKTSAVCSNMARIIKEAGGDFWAAAPYEKQTANLDINLGGIEKSKLFTKEELFSKIFGNDKPLLIDEITDKANLVATTSKRITIGAEGKETIDEFSFSLLKQEILDKVQAKAASSKAEFPTAIFIDEITQFSQAEISALNVFFNNLPNQSPLLITMGDTKQNGNLEKGEKHNINCFNVIRTPKLSISLRESNTLKKKNLDELILLFNKIEAYYRDHHTRAGGNYDNIIALISQSTNTDLTALKLSSFVDEKGKVFGEQLINSDGISLDYIRKIARTTDGVLGYITDNNNSDLCKAIKSDPELKKIVNIELKEPDFKVDIKLEKAVQGLEYETAIIDVDWSKCTGSGNMAPINTISNLYTLMGRSQTGTIIVDRGLSSYGPFHLKTITEKGYFDTKLDKDLVAKFKDNRVKVINRLAQMYSLETPKATITPSSIVNPPMASSPTISVAEAAKITDADAAVLKDILEGIQELQTLGPGKTKILVPNSTEQALLAYTFYNRSAEKVKNEDIGYLKKQGIDAINYIPLLNAIKNTMLYGTGLKGLEKILPLDNNLVHKQAKIVVRGSKYITSQDASILSGFDKTLGKTRSGFKQGTVLADGDPFLRVAVEIPRKNGEPPVYFTIAVLGTMEKIGAMPELQTDLQRLMVHVDKLKVGESINFEITDKNFVSNLVPFNAIQQHSLGFDVNGNPNTIEFAEFKTSLPGAFVSDPMILTSYAPTLINDPANPIGTMFREWVAKSGLSGEAAVFVSGDPAITKNEQALNKYAEERLAAFKAAAEGADPSKLPAPTVRMFILKPEALEPMDWIEKTMAVMRSDRVRGVKLKNPVGTMASPQIAQRIYLTLLKMYEDSTGGLGTDKTIHEFSGRILDNLDLLFDYKGKMRDSLIGYIGGEKGDRIKNSFGKYDPSRTANALKEYGADFYNNHAYKLLIALEISIFGGTFEVSSSRKTKEATAKLAGKETYLDNGRLTVFPLKEAFSFSESSWKDFTKVFDDKFKNAFGKGEGGFPQGIFTCAAYEISTFAKDVRVSGEPNFAERAIGSFRVNSVPSMPDILVPLKSVQLPEDVKQAIQLHSNRTMGIIRDAYEELLTKVVPEKQNDLIKYFNKLTNLGNGKTVEEIDKNAKIIINGLVAQVTKINASMPQKSEETLFNENYTRLIPMELKDQTIKTQTINFDPLNKILTITIETNEGKILKGTVTKDSMENYFTKIEKAPEGKKGLSTEEIEELEKITADLATKMLPQLDKLSKNQKILDKNPELADAIYLVTAVFTASERALLKHETLKQIYEGTQKIDETRSDEQNRKTMELLTKSLIAMRQTDLVKMIDEYIKKECKQ